MEPHFKLILKEFYLVNWRVLIFHYRCKIFKPLENRGVTTIPPPFLGNIWLSTFPPSASVIAESRDSKMLMQQSQLV